MPSPKLFPLQGTLLALSTQTSTQTTGQTSANLTMPMLDSIRFVLEVQTVSGTNPTMDVWLDTSADGGSNYYPFLKFAQATTTGQGQQITMRTYLGIGDAATSAVAPLLGSVDGTTGSGTILQNGPIDPRQIKIRTLIGATTSATAQFAYAVKWIGLAVSEANV